MNRKNFVKIVGMGLATVAGLPLIAKSRKPGFYSPVHCPQDWDIPRYTNGEEEHFGVNFKTRTVRMTHKFYPYLESEGQEDQFFFGCAYSVDLFEKNGIDRGLIKYHEGNLKKGRETYIYYLYCDNYPDLVSTTFTTDFFRIASKERLEKRYQITQSSEEWWSQTNDSSMERRKRCLGDV